MNEEKSLVIVPQPQMSLQDTLTLGRVLAASGRFSDATKAEQAVVKVLAGRELGFGPIASMTNINIIKGKISASANMMAHAVKRSDKYDYRVIELTNERCELVFFEGDEELGRSTFDAADAKKAGTHNMGKFPRNMLFARAMSNGVKWFCPDVFHTSVYAPEELVIDGEVIDIEPIQRQSVSLPITRAPVPQAPPVAPIKQADSVLVERIRGMKLDMEDDVIKEKLIQAGASVPDVIRAFRAMA